MGNDINQTSTSANPALRGCPLYASKGGFFASQECSAESETPEQKLLLFAVPPTLAQDGYCMPATIDFAASPALLTGVQGITHSACLTSNLPRCSIFSWHLQRVRNKNIGSRQKLTRLPQTTSHLSIAVVPGVCCPNRRCLALGSSTCPL